MRQPGSTTPSLGQGLAAVLDRVRAVRDRHDAEFAAALATGTADELGADGGYLEHDGGRVYLLEHLLPGWSCRWCAKTRRRACCWSWTG